MAGARADLTEAGAVPMAREEAEELRMSGRAAARWQIACFLPREEGERDLGTGRAEMEERLMARMAQPVPRLTATGGGPLNLREEQGVPATTFLIVSLAVTVQLELLAREGTADQGEDGTAAEGAAATMAAEGAVLISAAAFPAAEGAAAQAGQIRQGLPIRP